MVDQGGGTQKALTRNDISGLLSLKKEEEEEEEESGFFFKSNSPNLKGGEQSKLWNSAVLMADSDPP